MPYNYAGCDRSELNSYDTFPEGTYAFYIENIVEKTNSYGEQIVEIVLKPSDTSMQRYGKVWHRINLENEWTRKNIARLLLAVGQDPEINCEIFFNRFEGEHLRAKIKHNTGTDGKVYVNAQLLPLAKDSKSVSRQPPREINRSRPQRHEYQPEENLANVYDGEAGQDDIPF